MAKQGKQNKAQQGTRISNQPIVISCMLQSNICSMKRNSSEGSNKEKDHTLATK